MGLTRRGPAPRGLLGMLALIAIVEGFVARHAQDFSRFPIDDWRVVGRAARREAAGCGVLCLGDSLVKFGVTPAVLERRLGTKAYNLAVCGGQPSSSYFLLRRALESGARPSSVVVDFAPYLLAAGPRHNLRQWPELVGVREAIDLGRAAKHAGFSAELAVGMLLPTVKDRAEIRTSVAAALRGESEPHRAELDACRRDWKLNRGAMLARERPEFQGGIDPKHPGFPPRSWKCHPVNEAYIGRLLDLAEAHGIRVFWLLPPVIPKLQARSEELGLEAAQERLLRGFQPRYPGLTVIDARRMGFGHDLFIDPLHLNRRGAAALTGAIAAALGDPRRPGATDRWVVLEGAPPGAVEPSGMAIQDRDPARRR